MEPYPSSTLRCSKSTRDLSEQYIFMGNTQINQSISLAEGDIHSYDSLVASIQAVDLEEEKLRRRMSDYLLKKQINHIKSMHEEIESGLSKINNYYTHLYVRKVIIAMQDFSSEEGLDKIFPENFRNGLNLLRMSMVEGFRFLYDESSNDEKLCRYASLLSHLQNLEPKERQYLGKLYGGIEFVVAFEAYLDYILVSNNFGKVPEDEQVRIDLWWKY